MKPWSTRTRDRTAYGVLASLLCGVHLDKVNLSDQSDRFIREET